MAIQYIQITLYAFAISLLANFLRFRVCDSMNKWILVMASLVLVPVAGFVFDFSLSNRLLLLFIVISVICFRFLGGLASSVTAWVIDYIQTGELNFFILLSYFFMSLCIYLVHLYIMTLKKESATHLRRLIENSRQLNVFKEVSLAIQQTLKLPKLLQTIITSVTAGHGLGFNRAMILLVDEQGTKLRGVMGTGPMTSEEGYALWVRLSKIRLKLKELIDKKETERSADSLLNEKVKKLEISLEESNFLHKALDNGIPLLIKDFDENDRTLQMFVTQFNMVEMVVIPLISQGVKVGVLIIDNPVNKRPITASDIDSVIPLANQAAIAIQNTRLYSKFEDMALRDGLTGLLNQRAFQTLLEQHMPSHAQDPVVSLILLDIDFFKHYNDTNGHMLGNQVLVRLAEVIQNSIQNHDLAFRFGGEEFVILLPNTNREVAAVVAEQIRWNVLNTSFPCGEKQPNGHLTISLGVSSSDELAARTAFDLVDAADKALYRAKEQGKNKVVS